uniref:Uncharacterized protein n=1 Tax=Anguilla anguilla TaxID=7936 RepID=A0A0E9SBP2_ANGAN
MIGSFWNGGKMSFISFPMVSEISAKSLRT